MPSKSLSNEFVDEDNARTNDSGIRTIQAYYPSNLAGRHIRNAVTGAKYPWRVGSKESKLLFRVTDSSGICDKNGFVITKANVKDPHSTAHENDNKLTMSRDPNQCYYDSPEDYMRHRNVALSREIVDNWSLKRDELGAALEREVESN